MRIARLPETGLPLGRVVAYAETGQSAAPEELLPPGRVAFTDGSVGTEAFGQENGVRVNVDSGIPDATGLASMRAIRGVPTS